jgi:tRNA nucleotidyltransferase (CCA-adding enzyme)
MVDMQNPFRADSMDPVVQRARILAQEPRLLEAARTVAGRTPKALLVGGFVRDALLGMHPKDADLEVYGMPADEVEALLDGLFPGRVHPVGRAFGVFKVVVADGLDLDVAIPRRESKSGKGHRGFTITGDPGMSVEDAARRRDFTVNAIVADPMTGEVSDPVGGIADLEGRTLRVVDPKTFVDDPLRVYRAAQLAARFALAVEPETLALMSEMVRRGDLGELSPERVTEELKKLLLLAETPSVGFGLLRQLGVIEREYTEFQALIGLGQDSIWHPEGDVWMHVMMSLDVAARIVRQPERGFGEAEMTHVMLGVLCHDLGKATTSDLVDGRICARGHEDAGVGALRTLCARWTFPKTAVDAAIAIMREHQAPMHIWRAKERGEMDAKQYRNAVRRTLKRIAPLSWRELIAAIESDWRGRATENAKRPEFPPGTEFSDTSQDIEREGKVTEPLLHGRDLAKLGVPPGPGMGEWIRRVETARDEGEIETKEDAIGFVKTNIHQR